MPRPQRTFLADRFLQPEDYWDATEADQSQIAKIVDIGPQPCLAANALSDESVSFFVEDRAMSGQLRSLSLAQRYVPVEAHTLVLRIL